MIETSIYEYARNRKSFDPDRVALWFYGRAMTYGELFSRVDNVADRLYSLGIGEGSVVTVHLPNCPQAVIAVYAAAKLGAISDMAHPLLPPAALNKHMEKTKSRILITAGFSCGDEKFPKTDILIFANLFACPKGAVSFESLEKPCRKKAVCPLPASLSERPCAYFASSGTGGEPKIVVHSHRAMNAWVEDFRSGYSFLAPDEVKTSSVFPFFHATGLVTDIHRIISGGGTAALIARFDAEELIRILKTKHLNTLTGVPVMFEKLLQSKRFCAEYLPDLKECFTGGDKLPPKLRESLLSRFGEKLHFYESYGMAECLTACFFTGGNIRDLQSVCYPLRHCRAAVRGKDGEIASSGSGEILICTNTMMKNYLCGQGEDFIDWDGERWLATGDIGEVHEDGGVRFCGRLKNIIIRNGYNIYPLAVENVISGLPEIREVCAVGAKDGSTEAVRVYAVLNAGADQKTAEEKIRDICIEQLPKYIGPLQIRILPRLPRTGMNKIDRKSLRDAE